MNEMKLGKAAGLDLFPVVYLEKFGMAMLDWLASLLNANFDMGVKYL